MAEPIRFYSTGDEYGCFSNFSAHPVFYDGQTWPTSEHCFQAQKFLDPKDRQAICKANSPMIAARLGRDRKRPLRRDWESVKIGLMRAIVLAKFSQHADLRATLLATGDAKLIEHTDRDAFWGDGGNGSGKNWLGRILMEVREQLREDETKA
jgi:ribA/ribD-fused uncharacterized protein